MHQRILFTLFVTFASASFLGAASTPDASHIQSGQSSMAEVQASRRVHTIGNVWMSIGADGRLGTQSPAISADPDTGFLASSSFEFPAGSRREHLFISGVWIGGIFGTNDTNVMASVFVGSGSNTVFTPSEPIRVSHNPQMGHQHFEARYADTALSAFSWPVGRPLGVEVRQSSRAFEPPPYDRFVIVEYVIRNISRQTIRRPFIGFFADPDVFSELRVNQPEDGPDDDLTGFLPDRGIAYTIDNDGDVRGYSDVVYSSSWCPSGYGLAPIMIDPVPHCTTFNWWATNFSSINWGPSKVNSTLSSRMPDDFSQMYRVMSNGEIDYDQVFAAMDKQEQGWRAPTSTSSQRNIADGSDSRWVLAYGFHDLAPYDSLRLVMVHVAGDSIHTSTGRYPDPLMPDTFVAGLDFSNLRRSVDLARKAWSYSLKLDSAAPLGLKATLVTDRVAECTWHAPPSPDLTRYRLFRKTALESDWKLLAVLSVDVNSYRDGNVQIGVSYEYAVESVYGSSLAGVRSRPARVQIGLPRDIPTISAQNTPTSVRVNWQVPPLDSGFSTYARLNLYRKSGEMGPFTLYQSLSIADRPMGQVADPAHAPARRDPLGMRPHSFVDDSVTPGVMYHYRASFTNDLGLEGPLSSSDSALPMLLDRRVLVILLSSGSMFLPDTMRSFYGHWATSRNFDTTSPLFPAIVPMSRLMRYQLSVVVSEGTSNSISSYPPFERMLESYIANNGRVVLITRNHGSGSDGNGRSFPSPIVERYLGVHRTIRENGLMLANIPPPFEVYATAFFRSAQSALDGYPTIEADSSLGWSVPGIPYSVIVDTSLTAGRLLNIGYLDSIDAETQVLYRYKSAYDSTAHDGKPIAVKRVTHAASAILFNFPLSMMKREEAWRALTQAVVELGIDTIGYSPPTSTAQVDQIIDWLYGRINATPDPVWDVNRDGVIDIRDVVEELRR